jgi:AP-1 complex subunit sigma 1/2
MIHHYVECLDKYFGNVCELDIIFNFQKAYYIVEEILLAGHIQESGMCVFNIDKRAIMKSLQTQDSMLEEEKEDDYNNSSRR